MGLSLGNVSYLLYNNLPEDIISQFNKHNTTPHPVTGHAYPDGVIVIKMANNPDLVREFLLTGFTDLTMVNHEKYSHILEKDHIVIHVTRNIEAHHYYG